MQPSRIMGVKGDECQCGRRATVRHCPRCGSVRIYARMNRIHEMANGTFKRVDNEFRCNSCGHLFIEEEREFCEAPPTTAALALLKVKAVAEASKTGEYLNPSDARLAAALDALVNAPTPDRKKAYDMLVYKLRVEFADRKAAGEALPMSMDVYVESRLKELNVQPPEQAESTANTTATGTAAQIMEPIERASHPPDLADPQRDAIPIEERSIRLEWGRKKLAGRSLPDVEDYVKRRLAGELFND